MKKIVIVNLSNGLQTAIILMALFLCVGKSYAQTESNEVPEAVMADSEIFFSEEQNQNKSKQAAKLKNNSPAILPALIIALPPVVESELNAIKQLQEGKLARIGFGREMPSPYKDSMVPALTDWERYSDGGYLTTFSITSPAAKALRLKFLVTSMPDGAELRFFSPDSLEESFGPFGASVLMQERFVHNSAVLASYWSPSIQGDTLAVEIYIPPATSPEDFVFSIPQLSHFEYSPNEGIQDFKNFNQLGSSGSCNVDIACIGNISSQIVSSVAKYLFTGGDGYTYLCTGTLVSDTDITSSIPYFLTAQHCINKQAEAASAEFYWFFQRSGCGGSAPSVITRQVGGSDLLVSLGSVDMSLLKLRTSPPDGVGLSGWSSKSLVSKSELLGIHHPSGDLKKGSIGKMNDFAELFSSPNSSGSFIQLTWNNGITEPGSSGSGIWHQSSGKHYLVGTLTGGSSSCTSQTSPDYYGRFDLAFPSLRSFLAPTSADGGSPDLAEGRLLNISTNSFVDGTGVISGFIITGGARRVVVMGESVGSLIDPILKLTDKSGREILRENDNWKSDSSSAEVVAKLRAPRSPKDAAFAITLQPGAYLAKLSGVDGSVGKGLISVTEVPE